MESPRSPTEVTAGGLSIGEAALEVPHRIALVTAAGFFTFGGLAWQVARVVPALRRRGLDDPSSPVGVVGSNELETLVLLYAFLELAVPVALVHPRSPAEERDAFLAACGARWLEFPDLGAVSEAAVLPLEPSDDERCLAIVRTSGSSGQPKGVVLSRRAFVAAAQASAQNLSWQEEDRWLLSLPVAHVGGLSVITRCLLARRTVVVAPAGGFEAQRVGEWLQRWRISLLSLVPTMLRRLLDLPQWRSPPSLRALLLGGAAAPPSLLERAVERGVPVLTTWGLTEACSQVTTQSYAAVQGDDRGSWSDCGPPLSGMEVRIREGEIQLRGPQLLSGYLPANGPSPVDAEGWFITGDTGWLDTRGHLHILGRRDEVIITGGENVHPQEVEAVLVAHPKIEEACVVGVADEVWGQVVVAVLVAAPPSAEPLTDSELRVHLVEHLASFKHPRRVVWLRDLPKTASGKVDRRFLLGSLCGDLPAWPGAPPIDPRL